MDVANEPPEDGVNVMFPVMLFNCGGTPPLGNGLVAEYPVV